MFPPEMPHSRKEVPIIPSLARKQICTTHDAIDCLSAERLLFCYCFSTTAFAVTKAGANRNRHTPKHRRGSNKNTLPPPAGKDQQKRRRRRRRTKTTAIFSGPTSTIDKDMTIVLFPLISATLTQLNEAIGNVTMVQTRNAGDRIHVRFVG